MIKIEENKTRKKLRITQCVLFLVQIVLCSFPYMQGLNSNNEFYSLSVFDMLSYLGGDIPQSSDGSAFQSYIWYYFIFVIIPLVGFFFCAFDKERNLKNIVSVICCLAGVLSILFIVSYAISIGSLIGLLLYILICFITTFAMFARITPDKSN
jgi:hypothetical protein